MSTRLTAGLKDFCRKNDSGTGQTRAMDYGFCYCLSTLA